MSVSLKTLRALGFAAGMMIVPAAVLLGGWLSYRSNW